jgi:hypothetical protein
VYVHFLGGIGCRSPSGPRDSRRRRDSRSRRSRPGGGSSGGNVRNLLLMKCDASTDPGHDGAASAKRRRESPAQHCSPRLLGEGLAPICHHGAQNRSVRPDRQLEQDHGIAFRAFGICHVRAALNRWQGQCRGGSRARRSLPLREGSVHVGEGRGEEDRCDAATPRQEAHESSGHEARGPVPRLASYSRASGASFIARVAVAARG